MGLAVYPARFPGAGSDNLEFTAVVRVKLTRGLEAPGSLRPRSHPRVGFIVSKSSAIFIILGAAKRHVS